MSASDATNISHAVARDQGRRKPDVVQFIVYDLVDPNEQPYATFRFYYRSEGECVQDESTSAKRTDRVYR